MDYLLLAILISTAIFVLFRGFERLRVDVHQAITANYVVAALSGHYATGGSLNVHIIMGASWLNIALVTGVFFIIGFYFFAFSAVKAGVAITAVSSKMSVIIPVTAGFIFFGEDVLPLKIGGIALALLSFAMILWRKGERIERRYILLPALLLISNGINDTLLKTAQFRYIDSDLAFAGYLTVIFLVAMLLSGVHLGWRFSTGRSRLSGLSLLAGVALGLLNWGSTWFFLKGLSAWDVSIFVPLFNAGVVTLSAIIGLLAFRERLSRLNLAGILLAMAAIIIIAWQ